jgi:hypothetical protein
MNANTPVTVIAMPHNGRCALWPGDVDADGEPLPVLPVELLTLPIVMPEAVAVTYGETPDDVLAIDVLDARGNGRVRREDTQQVWDGICEFNADIASQDTPAIPAAVLAAILHDAADEAADADEDGAEDHVEGVAEDTPSWRDRTF